MKNIYVKNYRSILDSGTIELKSLTVVLGRNSAGKSSFIRLFPLLKQTLERKISDTLLWYGDYVDFGDFYNTVSRQKRDEPIEISFSINISPRRFGRFGLPGRLYKNKNNRVYSTNDKYVATVKLSIREKYIEVVRIDFFDQSIRLEIDSKGNTHIFINDNMKPFEKNKLLAFRDPGNIIPSIVTVSENKNDNFLPIRLDLEDIVLYCNKYIYNDKKEFNALDYLYHNNFFPVTSKENLLEILRNINNSKFQKKKITHKRFQKINDYIVASQILDIIDDINAAVLVDLQQTSYLKPIRAMVNRYYRVQGISINELDADGANIPMIIKNMPSSKRKNFELWSKEKFGVIFSVTEGEGHISLIIKNDIDSEVFTNVADTGYGYSQMLPIVMLLWMIHNKELKNKNTIDRTIVIEQPELHLHPAFQAKMIDVFVSIINEAEKNNVSIKLIFETHSETMVNRIGTLISENKIEANKVNILIFEKENDTTHILSKSFDEEGLLSTWPIGFFSTDEE